MLQGKIMGVEKKHLLIGVVGMLVLYYLSKKDSFKLVVKKMTAKERVHKGMDENAADKEMTRNKAALKKSKY